MKFCTSCNEWKPRNVFSKNKSKGDGLGNRCKECARKYSREYYHRRPEHCKSRHKKYVEANRFRSALSNAKTYAKRKGHAPCNATEKEIGAAFTGYCHTCGVPEADLRKKLCMDHCHETGEFRGWLCSRCNKVLGFLDDSVELLVELLHYRMNTK